MSQETPGLAGRRRRVHWDTASVVLPRGRRLRWISRIWLRIRRSRRPANMEGDPGAQQFKAPGQTNTPNIYLKKYMFLFQKC